MEGVGGDGPSTAVAALNQRRREVSKLFQYGITMSFCVAFVLTFFSILDFPVAWPFLLMYWIVVSVQVMKRLLVM